MTWLRGVWGRFSWLDRAVVAGFALLLLACALVRPVWRSADPSMALAEAWFENARRLDQEPITAPLQPVSWLLDPWGRPMRIVVVHFAGGSRDYVRGLLSDGPDGVLDTTDDGAATLTPAGDDVVSASNALGFLFLWGGVAAALGAVTGLCSYAAARRLRPIASLPRDLGASFLLGIPAWLGATLVWLLLRMSDVEPWSLGGGSPQLTVVGATTLVLLGVRRLHAPADAPPPARRSEADLAAELTGRDEPGPEVPHVGTRSV